jgi:hypothetical protein
MSQDGMVSIEKLEEQIESARKELNFELYFFFVDKLERIRNLEEANSKFVAA